MIKSLREQIWFIKGFLKKYAIQILVSLVVTVVLIVLGNSMLSRLPKPQSTYRVGIVGQFISGQIPPYIINFLEAGLITLDDKNEPQPGLAERWEIQDDGKTYIFYLRPDLKWSDGEPVKTSDIKISIPNITVETTDPNIIKFKIPTKFAPFLSLLNIPLLNDEGKIISPFDITLKQKSSGIIAQLTLQSDIDTIIFDVYPTYKQALTAFKLGQLNLVLNLPSSYAEESESFGKIQTMTNYDRVTLLIFNQQDPNLKDKNVRQGIAYALQDKTFGETEAITTISPNSWAFNPLVKTYPYNIARTKELIASPVTLELATSPELLSIAENIKNQLDSDLITIEIKVVTSTPEQFQLYLTTYNIPNDPDQYRDWHSTQATNIGRGSDEKIDKLLEDGRTTLEQKERKQIYFDFQKTFAEEIPAMVLFHPTTFDLARRDELFDIFN